MTFEKKTQTDFTNFLSNFMPNGRLTKAKYNDNSNLRKYLIGKSGEFVRLNDLFITFIDELDPDITTDFIENWESAIRIPDQCIPLATTIEDRRENILLKLLSLSVQTEQDYKDLADILGFTITFIYGGGETGVVIPVELPFLFPGDSDPNFTVTISGNFNSDPIKAQVFFCLIKLIIPSTYNVVFIST